MKARVLLCVAFFAALLVPTLLGGSADAQDPGQFLYQLIIDCPNARNAASAAGQAVRCPVRAEDLADMMGSPSVAVDVRNPNLLVLASLHGQLPSGGDGASERSRGGSLPYTTFTSVDGGRSWTDNFFPGPQDVRGSYGEHPQIVTDPYGHVYVGSLWARPLWGTEYQYVLSAQKFESLNKVVAYQRSSQGSYNVQFLDPFYGGNAMNQYWYVFNPRTDNMTIVWHESPSKAIPPARLPKALLGPATTNDKGYVPQPEVPDEMWHDREAHGMDKGPHSVIAFAWTNMTMKSKYHYALENNTIGPCSSSTNPVWSEGYIYVGCVADPSQGPFKWNPDTDAGRVEIFRFHSETGEPPQYIGSSPIASGSPKLGVRSDARLALFTVDVDGGGKTLLQGTFGTYENGKIEWSEVKDYSAKVPKGPLDASIAEANIQDLEYREYSGAVHLILKESVQYLGLPGIEGGPTVPVGPKYRKVLIAIDERWGYLTHYQFDVGRPTNRTDPSLLQYPEYKYNDLADDIVQIPQIGFQYRDLKFDDLYHREFFAVGDYGIIIFAEIIELTNLRPPGVPPPPPGPPPVPAPALSVTPSMVLLPLAGTSFAGLLAFALLANRRKNPLAAITKGE